jgi:hypothetical protein
MQAEAHAIESWQKPAGSPPAPDAEPVRALQVFPDRYRVKRDRKASILTCTEAPTLRVHIERGLSITATEARNFPEGSIFLDGAAQGEPFVCPERAIYNLDHHEGCVRAFTLATCEQAMVMLRKRLDLRRRDWTIYANDADLDTVLAIWVLVNHLRLVHESPEVCADILPLLRLEGVIDALGVELEDLCALSPEQLASARDRMNALLAPEHKLKAAGQWEETDLGLYVARQLRAIDRMVYQPEVLASRAAEIDELARAEIGPASLAVVCRSDMGVYEVERELRRLHGDRLGVFALQKGASTYTLRQVDPALSTRLEDIYTQLNLVDPGSDGCASSNRWGGSDEIGGSPRGAGTRMSPQQIAEACRRANRRADWGGRVARLSSAALTAVALMMAAVAPRLATDWFGVAFEMLGLPSVHPVVTSGALLLVLAGGLLVLLGRRTPGLYGHRSPTSREGWIALPLALAAGAMGGLWLPSNPLTVAPTLAAPWLAISLLVMPLGVELVFRGLTHGILARAFRIGRSGGPWRLSVPILVSASLYALCASLPGMQSFGPLEFTASWAQTLPAATPLAAFTFGLATGLARERSESVAAAVLLHWVTLGAWLAASSAGL